MKREVFSITTSEAYTSVGGLLAQTGQDRKHWRHVALKELIDNALDAAESAGIAPAVLVEITESPTGLTLAVTDNGSGIPADVVARLADFTAFISDKAAYRAPLRGAQGNAIKTLLGMPVALSDDRRSTTEIIACGVRHRLRVQASPTGAVRCEHSTEATDAATGTRLSIAIPGAVDRFNWQPDRWVIAYALFNPHAQLQIRKTDDCSGGYSDVTVHADDATESESADFSDLSLLPTVAFPGKWRKFLPTDPTPAHWYTRDEFARLVHLKAEQGHADQSVAEFVQEFKGTSRVWRRICQPLARTLGDLVASGEVQDLHNAIREHTDAPRPEVLGRVGPDHLHASIASQFTITGRHWYKHRYGMAERMPYLVECFVAETAIDGGVFYGLNYSVPFGDPLASTWLYYDGGVESAHAHGLNAFLDALGAKTHRRFFMNTTTTVAVHLVMPLLPSLDRGKSRLALPEEVATAISEVVGAACAVLHKEMVTARKREERNKRQQRESVARAIQQEAAQREAVAKRERKAADTEARRARGELPCMRDVLFDCLLPVYLDATANETIRISQRDLFYAVRPVFESQPVRPSKRNGEESTALAFSYFTQIVAQFRKERHPLEWIDRKARGTLFEPHGGKEIALGDRELREYRFPLDSYQGILFIEKDGVWQTLKDTGGLDMMRRYDLMVLASEGYSTEAVRQFFALAQRQHGYKILAWHDADPDGLNIARTLAEPTDLMPDHHLDVIDIGMSLAEGEALGLPFETYTRKEPIPQTLLPVLDAYTLALLSGDEVINSSTGRREWRNCKRIEINAMKAQHRPAWLEAKLADALKRDGSTARPALDVMLSAAVRQAQRHLEYQVRAAIEQRIDLDAIASRVISSIGAIDPADTVTAALQRDESTPWRVLVKDAVTARIAAEHGAISSLVDAAIAELVRPG